MQALTKPSTGEVKTGVKPVFLKAGANFLKSGQFTGTCSSCDKKKSISYVFLLQSGKVLVKECNDCMVEHF